MMTIRMKDDDKLKTGKDVAADIAEAPDQSFILTPENICQLKLYNE